MEMASLKTLCQIYDWKPRTVREWLKKGDFPPPYRHGRLLRWSVGDIDQWARKELVIAPTPSLARDIRL